MVYASFNLQNINAPVPPKWKHNEHFLDEKDIYDNFELTDNEMYDINYVMEQFELYCEPIFNFCAARYKFHQVSQREN